MNTVNKNVPLSICDWFMLFFAAWTVACNVTVYLEGSLFQASLTFGALSVTLFAGLWRFQWIKASIEFTSASPGTTNDQNTEKDNSQEEAEAGLSVAKFSSSAFCCYSVLSLPTAL